MDKFNQLIEIAREIANEVNLKQNKNLKKFMDSVFEKVVEEFDLCKDFQARVKVYGDAFEAIFIVIMETFFPDIKLIHQYEIPEICMIGERIKLGRPGMVRTDTVKKAMSNAAQVKFGLSEEVLFIVVTSHKPKKGNAKCMINLALKSGLFDMVVDITNFDELKKMVSMIKKRLT